VSYVDELRQLSEEALRDEIETKIADTGHDLTDVDCVASEIATTNAVGWGLDTFDVEEIEFVQGTVEVRISYQLTGDQEDDKSWHGTEISGNALAIINGDGEVSYTDVTASRDLGDDDSEYEEIFTGGERDAILFADISAEIKAYLARHPEKLYELTPRKFEELVASILTDFGFTTELTQATRDGGRDIYAYVRNAVTSFLMFVECKRWSPPRKVGIGIVQRILGAAQTGKAHKAMVVTTSYFTKPAQNEQKSASSTLDLKDYDALKQWLAKYNDLPLIGG
jgi:hypothetical protein